MSALSSEDRRWLDAAARYAAPFVGTTADTPTVAALVVDPARHTLIARAVTALRGRPHAEAQALEAAGLSAAGATLYVTLEPCHHWGRTPPCVDAVVRSGVMRVVIGAADPDPRTAGQGVARLESAGIEVVLANHGPSRQLHLGHFRRHSQDRPLVTLVAAERSASDAVWPRLIEGLRAQSDAVLVDAATARHIDTDPVVSLPGLHPRTPLRVVLGDGERLGRDVNLIGGFSGYRTVVIAETDAPVEAPASVEIIRVSGSGGVPDLPAALAVLARRGLQSVLVEGSITLQAALLEAGLVDRAVAAGEGDQQRLTAAGLAESARQHGESGAIVFFSSSDN